MIPTCISTDRNYPARWGKNYNFYAVVEGRKTGIFTDWAEANQSVNGYSGNNFQGCETLSEAEEIMTCNGRTDIMVYSKEFSMTLEEYAASLSSGAIPRDVTPPTTPTTKSRISKSTELSASKLTAILEYELLDENCGDTESDTLVKQRIRTETSWGLRKKQSL